MKPGKLQRGILLWWLSLGHVVLTLHSHNTTQLYLLWYASSQWSKCCGLAQRSLIVAVVATYTTIRQEETPSGKIEVRKFVVCSLSH